MSRLLSILCVALLMSFAVSAYAQDKPKAESKAEPQKTEKTDPKPDDNSVEDTINLDRFFKKGEENAKNGASCDKPAEPANPIA